MPVPDPANSTRRGYTDKHGVAAYFGVSVWQVDRWIRQGVLRPGVPMTPEGKHLFAYRDLDLAYDRAARSRKPRRTPRGIVRQRLEQQLAAGRSAQAANAARLAVQSPQHVSKRYQQPLEPPPRPRRQRRALADRPAADKHETIDVRKRNTGGRETAGENSSQVSGVGSPLASRTPRQQ
jgi:hypothetical protein